MKKEKARKAENSGSVRQESRNSRPNSDSGRESNSRKTGRRDLAICAGLVVATLAIYAQVINHQFINLDDDIYIYQNPIVAAGLTTKGVAWAFTTFHAANWHPLTWLSHMLNVEVFGLNPGPHLAINVLFHILNTLLVFATFRYITQRVWRSAIVAALFALHPMHVESVAWAAERKDVLSTFLALLCLLAYIRYAKAPSAGWQQFLPVTVLFALALMAKPMFVTWPFVMLLLDFWPLNRLKWRPDDGLHQLMKGIAPLAREKTPLFVLVAASIAITYIAQSSGGAVRAFADAPLSTRIANAVLSYASYLASLFWPAGLGVYYPFPPEGIPAWKVAVSLALLAGITIVAMRAMKGRGYLITGWAWYLGTLIPVLGLVQVGGQAMADRYSYIPSVGLFVMVVWGIADLVAARRIPISIAAAAAVTWLTIMGSLAWAQTGYWRDSITLYRHTLLVAPNNLVIHYNLAHALGKRGDLAEAVAHFSEALRINPDFLDALINIGITLIDQGKFGDAVGHLARAIEIDPKSNKAHLQLGIALAQSGNSGEALTHFYRAMELAPGEPGVRTNLGLLLARMGKLPEAKEQLNEALRLNPNVPEAHNNLGLVLLMEGKPEQSILEFSAALRLKPGFRLAQENLNRAQSQIKAQRE